MKYIVYQTTNLKKKIENTYCFYVGVHKTENPDVFDGYLGCGVWATQPSTYNKPKTPFQYAVRQYGVNAFCRKTLYVFDTQEEAYEKEAEIVNKNFLKLPYTYNRSIGGRLEERNIPLYQFDLQGNLVKKWINSQEAGTYYKCSINKFQSPKVNKCLFMGYYWSTSQQIDITEYSSKPITKSTYLYSKEGELIKVFESQASCAEYIHYDKGELSRAIKNKTLIKKQYYASLIKDDTFDVRSVNNYLDCDYYVYNVEGVLLGVYHGKDVMNVIHLKKWDYIHNIFAHNNNWYQDFYLALQPIDKVPIKRRRNGICINVYDENMVLIDQLKSIKETIKKYHVPVSKIRNIQQGNRVFNGYTFEVSK